MLQEVIEGGLRARKRREKKKKYKQVRRLL
jgi:hypothetical protein